MFARGTLWASSFILPRMYTQQLAESLLYLLSAAILFWAWVANREGFHHARSYQLTLVLTDHGRG